MAGAAGPLAARRSVNVLAGEGDLVRRTPLAWSAALTVSEGTHGQQTRCHRARAGILEPTNQPAAPPAPSEPAATQGPDPVDTRLVIEMDQASGSFIYKTIDRRTGEVVLQLPRDQLLKMRDGAEYEAGAVIRTEA